MHLRAYVEQNVEAPAAVKVNLNCHKVYRRESRTISMNFVPNTTYQQWACFGHAKPVHPGSMLHFTFPYFRRPNLGTGLGGIVTGFVRFSRCGCQKHVAVMAGCGGGRGR